MFSLSSLMFSLSKLWLCNHRCCFPISAFFSISNSLSLNHHRFPPSFLPSTIIVVIVSPLSLSLLHCFHKTIKSCSAQSFVGLSAGGKKLVDREELLDLSSERGFWVVLLQFAWLFHSEFWDMLLDLVHPST